MTIGDKVGKLTILEITGEKCRCLCECGAVIPRMLATLRVAKRQAMVPQCKQCLRIDRKRKNPGGGVGTKSLRASVVAMHGETRGKTWF